MNTKVLKNYVLWDIVNLIYNCTLVVISNVPIQNTVQFI